MPFSWSWPAWRSPCRPSRRKATYLLLVILPIVYQAWTGGDPVSIWRIMAPVQPLAAVLFALGGDRSPASMEGARLRRRAGRACLQLVTAIGILSMNLIFGPEILLQQTWFPNGFLCSKAQHGSGAQ